MSNFVFNTEKINKRLKELENSKPFIPDAHEPQYTVTQLFEGGVKCTLKFVIRDGRMIYYDSKTENTNAR